MAFPLPAALPLQAKPLVSDALALLCEYLPSPTPLFEAIDRSIPMPIKQLVAEAPLNRIFAEAIAEGEFDDFEDRRIRLEVNGGHPGITFGFWAGRLRVLDGPGEATIRGSLSAFKTLSARQQDPDQLFFQRRLMIEGDTELGLALKNLLDSLEWDFNIRQLLFF
ncbi:SCP-2 sterol transfer family protein [Marinobacter sp. LV10R510-11A]|uniref:ubiquinone anaerobic biosynthesis accessory factor UbiT n=1 Tax=Marinobacter sp. LV10R510-11A TaxID=1415568 RepID=UPI000BB95C0A|nr:SCP2 sterol-binding domain-containing protein [Marinobacter sp. LV10R510-11A]SOB78018.1 SCP-2 sterol transfer family protein [Marinobacter sp. LV10R510-11A]